MRASDYLFIILLFFKTTGPGLCINSFLLKVPFEVDLQDKEVTLDCRYDMGNDELYSVKWYKDEEEFFGYIPRGYGIHTFPVPGVTVINGDDVALQCDWKHCPVTLTNMTRLTEGAYKCEVSTEAPKFSLFFETANLSIVARPRGVVQINTPKREYADGEEIFLNCTSPPAFPPPNIRWYANGELIGPENIVSQSDSLPDERGLVTRSLAIHLIASKDLFVQVYGALELKCEVHTPLRNPLYSSISLWLEGLQEQKFELLTESGTASTIQIQILLLSISILYLLFNIKM